MKTIGYVHSVAVTGGAERVTQAIVRGLPRQNYRPVLFSPETGSMTRECEILDARVALVSLSQPAARSPAVTALGFARWYRTFRQHRIDILHTADLICTRSLLGAAGAASIPIVCHIHFPVDVAFCSWVFGRSRHSPHSFVFCSEELRACVGDTLRHQCPESAQVVIHNGVNTDRFHPTAGHGGPLRVGIIANLQERKGHLDFLAMATIVSKQHPNVVFDVIGGDVMQEPREDMLKAQCARLGLEEKVIFHGQVDEVLPLLQRLDIVVCASHEEAFPISILEAMACGKAIVSTDVNGIPEAIPDERTGTLVPPRRPDLLADAVLELLDSPERRGHLGSKARERVVEEFEEEVFVRRVAAHYDAIG